MNNHMENELVLTTFFIMRLNAATMLVLGIRKKETSVTRSARTEGHPIFFSPDGQMRSKLDVALRLTAMLIRSNIESILGEESVLC